MTTARVNIEGEQVWRALGKASYAVLGFEGPDGEPRSSGVVYALVDQRMYVVTASGSLKARCLADGQVVAVTVPVRRGGLLSLVVPIPPASITFRARVTVHRAGSVDIGAISKQLARMVPEQGRDDVVLELEPVGTFLTYGIGVSLRAMLDPAVALARVPVGPNGARG